ncbi:hypothetical protein LA080_012498 [Diaporthe eres]|uniref:Uncharacterized protein n=1 Tax=Diaporthe vaccinii TaxID=105482 RepID=A0ABR4E1U1_9PEZI|nr:hypothetical protein LA080_012498 [Diaporthe eres]
MADLGSNIEIPAFVSFTKTYHNKPYEDISPARAELSASGKNVVITGGGTGVGLAIAMAFSQAGAKSVSILGRRLDRLETAAIDISNAKADPETLVIFETADLMDRAQVDKAFRSLHEKVGKLDILVSNAATLIAPGPLLTSDPEAVLQGFKLNALSGLHAVQAFMHVAVEEPTVINTSAAIVHTAPFPGTGAYGVAKAAVFKMLDYLAAENPNMHVVSFQPGILATEMTEGKNIPAQDVVELPGQFAVWLASPEAKFLRSKFVWANWDVKELLARKDEIKETKLLNLILDGVLM